MSPKTPYRQSIQSLRVLEFSFIVALACICVSCTFTTKPQTGSLSGFVKLINDTGDSSLDPVDFSGVTVDLYSLAEIDTSIVRLNWEYPQIGVNISQETEFDHRLQDPVKTVITNEEGNFTIENAKTGHYNVVFRKQGWGYRYIYNVEINSNDSILKEITNYYYPSHAPDRGDEVFMYPLINLTGVNNGMSIAKSDHVYLVSESVTITSGVVIQPRSRITIAPGHTLTFADVVDFPESTSENLFHVTSSAMMDSPSAAASIDRYQSLRFSQNSQINKTIASFGSVAFSLFGDQNFVANSIVRDCDTAVYTIGNFTTVSNTVMSDVESLCLQINQHDASPQNEPSVVLDRNIFSGNKMVVKTMGHYMGIMNNYFINNDEAILSTSGYHRITNNCFDNNNAGIVCTGSQAVITDNEFCRARIHHITFDASMYNEHATPTINRNNFLNDRYYFITIKGNAIVNDIDATNNYWISSDVGNQIIDKEDNPLLGGYVIYIPRLIYPNSLAGIRTNI